MPTKSKAQVKADEAADKVLAMANLSLAWACNFPSVLEQATGAFKGLNVLAEAIRESVPARKRKALECAGFPPVPCAPEGAHFLKDSGAKRPMSDAVDPKTGTTAVCEQQEEGE